MPTYFTSEHYRQWQWIWTPFFPTRTGLFLVRYPGDLIQMPKQVYKKLMKLRFSCLIHDATEQQSANQTHLLLCQALRMLHSPQEPPRLTHSEEWREAWAELIIEFNQTFFQRLSTHPLDRHFPVPMHPPLPSEQAQLRPLHDEMRLIEWLGELVGEHL